MAKVKTSDILNLIALLPTLIGGLGPFVKAVKNVVRGKPAS